GKRNIKFQNTPIDVETVEDKDDKIVVQESNHLVESSPSQPLSINILKIHESKENIQPKTSKISAFVNESIIATNKTENTTSKINEHELNPVVHVSLPSSQKSVLIGKPYFTDTSTNDEDDEDEFNDHDEDIILRRARTFSSQKETPINNDEYEERFSLKMNNSELHGLNNDLILTEGYHYCSDDHGLIKPLESSSSLRRMIPPPPPKRFTKYVSSRFLLPTPSKISSNILAHDKSLTQCLGFVVILCFCAITIVTLIVASVNIQLLRLGLINVTTDGHTYQKEPKDFIVLTALTLSCMECLVCLLSILIGIRLAFDAKNQRFRKKEGAFFVQILSEKDIVVVSKAPSSKYSSGWNGSLHSSSS
ncbi:unnamed protein product, partial [Didymodactylos carnosus]